jgi:hypothetical protein
LQFFKEAIIVSYCRQTTDQLQQILAVVVLTSILSLAFDMTFIQVTWAGSINHWEGVAKENLTRHSLTVASFQSSDANLSSLALAGIGRELSHIAESLLTQLPREIAKELPHSSNLPDSVANAVLQDAQMRSHLSVKQLRIVNAEPHNWPDGCLGLASPDTFCTQIVVPGWQVTVESGKQRFVYRTNNSGSLVKLEQS